MLSRMTRRIFSYALGALVFVSLSAVAPVAVANGALTHIHISQLARDALEPGPLRTFLDDPAAMDACERGSMFPDSGYAAEDPYGEFSHWEPFFDPYLRYVDAERGGDFGSPEAKEELGFLLGMMSHGIADQVYDTTLLARSFEVDGPEPDGLSVDQYADYFLVIDHGIVLKPDTGAPFASLTAVLRAEMGRDDLQQSTLENGMDLISISVRAQGLLLAKGSYLTAWNAFPFLGTHIYNERATGSIPWLGKLVARYWESIWARAHGAGAPDQHMIVRTMPEDGAVNFPIDSSQSVAYSRIGVVFGYGVRASETFPLMTVEDPQGTVVPVSYGSPYGGEDRSFLFLSPNSPLAYDTTYTVRIAPGVAALGGETTTQPYVFSFRTRCADDKLADCPPLEPPLVTGEIPDALPDTEADAGTDEPGGEDAALPATNSAPADSGCNCRTGAASAGATWEWWAVWGLLWLARKRVRRA